ncbi:PREDICTED: TBC1 domain family member 7-like [Amphimedon queenslandica]|uniref:TBC1 domain family member 7 n=1 Tax=Amphimedon queenslandica TaxID=400682 RepID=A0A1X7UVF5_AMPQE|nr:PREDICTED: TBC1 domain family member 7-like [Amphimedon queenslandica]|eukprot:XP_003386738.1 PREDICTED: TBC1 domain family member 7-like [Amphimedon queenslandica]
MTEEGIGKNFRSAYYETLGFRENEKSISQLENQLKADLIDLPRLKAFCLKNSLPALYRPLVWKILLGAVPCHQDPETQKYVRDQKIEQFQDLKHSLSVLNAVHIPPPASYRVTGGSPISPIENLVYMYGLEKGRFSEIKRDSSLRKSLHDVAKVFLDCIDGDEMEIYFCFLGFTAIINSIREHTKEMLEELMSYLIQKENVLYCHLSTLGVLQQIPCKRWFFECFLNEFPLPEIEIIWDRLIGGSYSVLIYIAISLILHRKRALLMSKSIVQALKLFDQLLGSDASIVLKQGLELWEHSGSALVPGNSKIKNKTY